MKTVVDGPVLGLNISGIKCDAAGCGYNDTAAPHDGEVWQDYLDRPCPNCGASLLTQADFDLMNKINAIAEVLNEIGTELGLPKHPSGVGEPIKLGLHGDGSLTIHLPKVA